MAEAHHDDHGNTPAAWFLTVSWMVIWIIGGVMIIATENVVLWSLIALGASVVSAAVAGLMKKAGFGRTTPRVAPAMPTPVPVSTDGAGEAGQATDPVADQQRTPEPVAGS